MAQEFVIFRYPTAPSGKTEMQSFYVLDNLMTCRENYVSTFSCLGVILASYICIRFVLPSWFHENTFCHALGLAYWAMTSFSSVYFSGQRSQCHPLNKIRKMKTIWSCIKSNLAKFQTSEKECLPSIVKWKICGSIELNP